MAHFAEINDNNIVTRVIVVHNNEITVDGQELEFKGIDFCEGLFGHRNWVQTSYNGNIRYNFAGVGYTFDEDNDAFYAPQPFQVGRLMKTLYGKHQYHIQKMHHLKKYTSGMKIILLGK
jgi:hypothetical protein